MSTARQGAGGRRVQVRMTAAVAALYARLAESHDPSAVGDAIIERGAALLRATGSTLPSVQSPQSLAQRHARVTAMSEMMMAEAILLQHQLAELQAQLDREADCTPALQQEFDLLRAAVSRRRADQPGAAPESS